MHLAPSSRGFAISTLQSLRGRLVLLLILLAVAAIASGALMIGLFRQSAVARSGQARAETAQACDAIAAAYRFYSAGWRGPTGDRSAAPLHRDLSTVTQTALRTRMGIEGGVWQQETGSLGYAFPTYQGSGPKTDLPQAELPRIEAINQSALRQDRLVSSRYEAGTQILLMTACPLPGPIPALTAWTMTRVVTFAGTSYQQLMAGLTVLLLTVLAAAIVLSRVTMTWSRHVGQIENALRTHDVADLPVLRATGEQELDRIVDALNEVGRRLADARARADELTRQVAAGERLAAIGRVAAGVAHEIRNPIAAMRLKAENALVGNSARKDASLVVILSQIERLDHLLGRLLRATETEKTHPETVDVGQFMRALQERIVRPVGGKPVAVDVRVIAATHRDLQERVREGSFREDLFYRLHVVPIHLPPLRERIPDIVPLAANFLQQTSGKSLSADAAARLVKHAWPGNVRELKNAMERAAVLVRGDVIQAEDLDFITETAHGSSAVADWPDEDLPGAVARLEEMLIRRALQRCAGNRADAARALGIHRQLLYSKLKRYSIDVSGDQTDDVTEEDSQPPPANH